MHLVAWKSDVEPLRVYMHAYICPILNGQWTWKLHVCSCGATTYWNWNYMWYACHFPTPLSLNCRIIYSFTYYMGHHNNNLPTVPLCTIYHTASIRLQSDSEGEYHSSKAGESDARSTLRTNIVVKYRTWPPAHVQLKCVGYSFI